MTLLALALVALAVGVLIGAVGIGGVLLIPALELLGGLRIQSAMATSLFSFIFTGLVGSWLFQRRGSIDWALTAPLCVGAFLFGIVGAWANARLDGAALGLILGLLIVAAGAYTLASGSAARTGVFAGRPRLRWLLLLCIGALTGFGSGLTGVGGPALMVPMMVLAGFAPLVAIGSSQVIQILAALSGSAGHAMNGTIDFPLAAGLTVVEVLGVWIGVHLAHAVDARLLRRAVGVLCVGVGIGLVWCAL